MVVDGTGPFFRQGPVVFVAAHVVGVAADFDFYGRVVFQKSDQPVQFRQGFGEEVPLAGLKSKLSQFFMQIGN